MLAVALDFIKILSRRISKRDRTNFILGHLTLVSIFGFLYFMVSNYWSTDDEKIIQTPLSLLDCMYYSLATQTTVGFGDIVSKTTKMKVVMMCQLLSVFGVFAFIFF